MSNIRTPGVVFISGSMSVKTLDEDVRDRLDNILAKKFNVIVGDAIGVDMLVQKFFKHVPERVTVYHMGNTPRNLANHAFSKKRICPAPNLQLKSGREWFTLKDMAMTADCDYGLVLWDGKSVGTLNNLHRLARQNKPTLIYLTKQKRFFTAAEIKVGGVI